MSVQADHSPAKVLELPSTWLAHLVQHVALGAGGLASAAALSQTCKSFHTLSESSAVMYRNLHLGSQVNSLDHPFFQWLAKRHSRVAGLTAKLQLPIVNSPGPVPEQLRVLFGIPGLHLTLRSDVLESAPDDPLMTKVLRPHGHLIDHLISEVWINEDGLKLQDFCEAAAPCRSLDLTIRSFSEEPHNMGALSSVAGSLVRLNLYSTTSRFNKLESGSSVSLLSQLTSLSLDKYDFGDEAPWIHLAGLTNLKNLFLRVAASGDPSPLSVLTRLSSLELQSLKLGGWQGGLPVPCTFSSMQPFSTMPQLVELVLKEEACSATSLHGLAGLSRLTTLRLMAPMLKSLEGVSTGLSTLFIYGAQQLESLAGVEPLQGLQGITVLRTGVTSLHPLAALGSLGDLHIGGAFTSLAGLEGNICLRLHSLNLEYCWQLRQISGIEGLTALQELTIYGAGVTSLQPVGQLVGGLRKLTVWNCSNVQEKVLELPHIQPTADVVFGLVKVKELVLAGGVRKEVGSSDSDDEEWWE